MRQTRHVPVLPGPRARALLVLWNPDATLREVAAVVAVDPAMTAQVLRAANSVLSAPVDRISTAHDAVVRLGFDTVKRLIEAAVIESQFRDLEGLPLDADEAWRYSLACAILAEALADEALAPLAFTAGLLHDIGRLALILESPSRYRAVIRAVVAGIDQLRAEHDQFATTHAVVGAEIARAWHLPEPIADAAMHHHEQGQAGITEAVSIARATALVAGYSEGLGVQVPAQAAESGLAVLATLGGPRGLGQRIRWYCEALAT